MVVVPLTAAKRGGTIERRELVTYPAGAVYKVQPKAWFSEDIMLEWVEEVLAPYVLVYVHAPHSHPIISEGEAMVGGDLL